MSSVPSGRFARGTVLLARYFFCKGFLDTVSTGSGSDLVKRSSQESFGNIAG